MLDETRGALQSYARERDRLIRLCARLTGNIDAAEDLAQEVLLEAWRHEHALRDPRKRAQWLSGIARNVCLRWGQRRGRELALLGRTGSEEEALGPTLENLASDASEPEEELERNELADLLDRALALLPPETRDVLVARYAEESSHAAIADRLRLSEGAVKVRLHRGRLALRRVLTGELRHEAAVYGFAAPDADAWRETRIWCPVCGMRRLSGRFNAAEGRLLLRCPDCYYHKADGFNSQTCEPDLFAGVNGYKPAFSRVLRSADNYFGHALWADAAPCRRCGHDNPLRRGSPERVEPRRRTPLAVHVTCELCGSTTDFSLQGLALALPQGRRFWQRHPHLRTLPIRELEHQGVAALVTTLESVTDRATLAVIAARDTFRVLSVHGAPDA